MKNKNKTVVVGMSGGVDSSVSALLLKKAGYSVIGMFMKNWDEIDENGVCPATQEFEDVRRVCETIDIPYYNVNFVEDYWNQVFLKFVADLEQGFTPNPDILCNREIKFGVFFEKALELGADFLATGHYCQNIYNNQTPSLVKGLDPNKDQTYFLYTINKKILERVLFPIGHLEKKEVRAIAKENHLVTSEKKDSTGICFIGKRNFRSFVNKYIAFQSGDFVTLQGKKVGTHCGAAFYTLGQRKGLAIGGAGDAWFVVGKDITNNIVYVEQGSDHPALYCHELKAFQLSWVNQEMPSLPFTCSSKVRYRQVDQPCTIHSIENGVAHVTFPNPQRAVTPGQSIVFYQDQVCLGGGIIREVGPSLYKP